MMEINICDIDLHTGNSLSNRYIYSANGSVDSNASPSCIVLVLPQGRCYCIPCCKKMCIYVSMYVSMCVCMYALTGEVNVKAPYTHYNQGAPNRKISPTIWQTVF